MLPLNMLKLIQSKGVPIYIWTSHQHLLAFSVRPTEISHIHGTRFPPFPLSLAWWGRMSEKGKIIFPSLISNATIHLLLCIHIYSFFLPSGHLIFLLLLSTVINICIPLTSRQPKSFPTCAKVPAVDSHTGWWVNRAFISSVSSFTAQSRVWAPQCLVISQKQLLFQSLTLYLPLLSMWYKY